METKEYQLLSQQLSTMTTLMNAQFNSTHDRLDKINGKVAHHEAQINEVLIERAKNREEQKNAHNIHILQCPVRPKVEALERDSISSKAVRKWIVTSVSLTAVIVTIIFSLFKMFTGSV